MKINYIEGNLFEGIKGKKNVIIIPHVCNNQRKWGKGFVVPLGKHFPLAEKSYKRLLFPILGEVDYVQVDNFLICNMIAQELGGKRPLYYNHLAACLTKIVNILKGFSKEDVLEIHAPAFGSGLAGGDWNIISELIEDSWIRTNAAPVNIYFLPGTLPNTREK